MKIYVASSWRNLLQPAVVHVLRRCGHDVYDFKHPPTSTGLSAARAVALHRKEPRHESC